MTWPGATDSESHRTSELKKGQRSNGINGGDESTLVGEDQGRRREQRDFDEVINVARERPLAQSRRARSGRQQLLASEGRGGSSSPAEAGPQTQPGRANAPGAGVPSRANSGRGRRPKSRANAALAHVLSDETFAKPTSFAPTPPPQRPPSSRPQRQRAHAPREDSANAIHLSGGGDNSRQFDNEQLEGNGNNNAAPAGRNRGRISPVRTGVRSSAPSPAPSEGHAEIVRGGASQRPGTSSGGVESSGNKGGGGGGGGGGVSLPEVGRRRPSHTDNRESEKITLGKAVQVDIS